MMQQQEAQQQQPPVHSTPAKSALKGGHGLRLNGHVNWTTVLTLAMSNSAGNHQIMPKAATWLHSMLILSLKGMSL
jgi:hypothetical protein